MSDLNLSANGADGAQNQTATAGSARQKGSQAHGLFADGLPPSPGAPTKKIVESELAERRKMYRDRARTTRKKRKERGEVRVDMYLPAKLLKTAERFNKALGLSGRREALMRFFGIATREVDRAERLARKRRCGLAEALDIVAGEAAGRAREGETLGYTVSATALSVIDRYGRHVGYERRDMALQGCLDIAAKVIADVEEIARRCNCSFDDAKAIYDDAGDSAVRMAERLAS